MMICRKFYSFTATTNTSTVRRAFHAKSGGLMGSAAIRGIPSSVVDIYKALDYECPEAVASPSDSRDVARAVNGAADKESLMSLGMSKSMAVKIVKSRERHRRDFERVEQFLDLDQMTTKKLEREVGKMVAKMKEGEEAQADGEEASAESPVSQEDNTYSKEENNLRKLQRMIAPAVDPGVWASVDTVVGIKISLEAMSYAKISREMELLDWNVMNMIGRSASKSRANFEFPHILNAAADATARVPDADAYVLETPPVILGQKDIMLNPKVSTMRMQSTVAALLSQRFERDSHRIFEVKYGMREALLGREEDGGGQTNLKRHALQWLNEDKPMSPAHPSMRVQVPDSERGLIDILDEYGLEKEKKEQVKHHYRQI